MQEQVTKVSPCFVCGKDFDPVVRDPGDFNNQPYDGICCETVGNYGSSQVDMLHQNSKVIFNVCDRCWEERSDRAVMMVVDKRPTFKYYHFNHVDIENHMVPEW